MAKRNEQAQAQEQEQRTVSQELLYDVLSNQSTNVVKTEKSGTIIRDYIDIPVKTKDKETGEEVTTYYKCRNELAVNSLSVIGLMKSVRDKSVKNIVLAMAKITNEQAQAVHKSLKTAKALIKSLYPDYSDNTINKYRRIGLLFSRNTSDMKDFHYISFIEEDTPISNLDAVLTLFDGLDIEQASVEEREKAVADFYDKYIITDMIHLQASQSKVKKEVHDILNPVITVEAREVEAQEQAQEQAQAQEQTQAEEISTALTAMSIMFKGNAVAEQAIATLMQELSKLFE